MSETAISRLTISSPFGVRTLRLRLFLLTLVSLKLPDVFRLTSRCCGVVVLGSRPRSLSGHSILITSAPNAPSQRVAQGPARTQLKSTTRMLSRARGCGIGSDRDPGPARPVLPGSRMARRRFLHLRDLAIAQVNDVTAHAQRLGLQLCIYLQIDGSMHGIA